MYINSIVQITRYQSYQNTQMLLLSLTHSPTLSYSSLFPIATQKKFSGSAPSLIVWLENVICCMKYNIEMIIIRWTQLIKHIEIK